MDRIIGLAPDRIALFSYAHVPWLKKQQGAFATFLPEGMQKFEIFRTGLLKFLEAGYLYIGMDHFARPNDELATAQTNRTLHRNFQGYTTKAGADLYGMGVTAISGFSNAYAQNFRELPAWEKAVHERGIATMRGYHLSQEDRLRRDVISRLQTMLGMVHGTSFSEETMKTLIARSVHIIVHLSRFSDGKRRLTGIAEITGQMGATIQLHDVFLFERTGTTASGGILGVHKQAASTALGHLMKRAGTPGGH